VRGAVVSRRSLDANDPAGIHFHAGQVQSDVPGHGDSADRKQKVRAFEGAIVFLLLDPQMLLWPAIYSALALLIFVLPPYFPERQSTKDTFVKPLVLGVLLYLFYEWPLWARSFFNTRGRTVYAYPNLDIDKGSFIVQELIVFGFCIMLGFLWAQWVSFFNTEKECPDEPQSYPGDPVRKVFDVNAATQVSLLFTHWQFASLILAGGFFFFTRFFWGIVGELNDQRYILSAINAHLLWGISWSLMTLPLIESW
jgi:hypothetical protein